VATNTITKTPNETDPGPPGDGDATKSYDPQHAGGAPGESRWQDVPWRIWLAAARPRTLPLAVAPVLVGTALASQQGFFRLGAFLAALLGAIFIQVGTNLANDYSDARRGADMEDRLGPVRVTAGGLVPPRQVLIASWVSFGVAVLAGLYGWVLLIVGALSIMAGILYTGGPRPYGYEGLGEAFVFVFFGLVAVVGSYYVQAGQVTAEAFALAVPVGLLSAAALMVNNIRDIDTDERAGKFTLAVRLGRHTAQRVFAVTLYLAYAWLLVLAIATGKPWILLAMVTLPIAPPLARTVLRHTDGAALNRALAQTAMLAAAFCALLALGVLT
jgi:1,4-dihydroxy-2-naphthoate polyprenyltransferase